jgi:hypothetical protein
MTDEIPVTATDAPLPAPTSQPRVQRAADILLADPRTSEIMQAAVMPMVAGAQVAIAAEGKDPWLVAADLLQATSDAWADALREVSA